MLEQLREIDISPKSHRPGQDKYLSARAFEALPYIYNEKGKFLVDFYTYFRWMDDIADSPDWPIEMRKQFMDRQITHITGQELLETPLPIEEFFQGLNFNAIPNGGKPEVIKQFAVLAGTIKDDLDHFGLIPRTKEEARDYGTRVLLPYAQVISLTLNGEEIQSTPQFEGFLADWNYMGSLMHFPKDKNEESIIKVGFTSGEVDEIMRSADEEGRRRKINEIFTHQRFRTEWKQTLSDFRAGISSFKSLNMPAYQKLISASYLSIREPIRLPKIFERLEKELAEGSPLLLPS